MNAAMGARWEPCSECGRPGCWANARSKAMARWKAINGAVGSCRGWFPAGCMNVPKSEVKRGRKGIPYVVPGEHGCR